MSRFILICLLVVCAVAVALLVPMACDRSPGARNGGGAEVAALEARVKELEAEVASLRAQLAAAGKPVESAAATAAAPKPAEPPIAAGAADGKPADPAAAAAAGAKTAESSATVRVTENPALKGVMGRIVVTFPKGMKISGTRTDIHEAGKKQSIASEYGDFSKELIPGKYDVVVTNTKVASVEVKSRHDSTIPVGVLRINAADSSTRVDVFAKDGKANVTSVYGSEHIGLPVGQYKVTVAGQSMPVEIKAGEATDF